LKSSSRPVSWAPNFLTNFDGLTDDLVKKKQDYVGTSMITNYLRVELKSRFHWFYADGRFERNSEDRA